MDFNAMNQLSEAASGRPLLGWVTGLSTVFLGAMQLTMETAQSWASLVATLIGATLSFCLLADFLHKKLTNREGRCKGDSGCVHDRE